MATDARKVQGRSPGTSALAKRVAELPCGPPGCSYCDPYHHDGVTRDERCADVVCATRQGGPVMTSPATPKAGRDLIEIATMRQDTAHQLVVEIVQQHGAASPVAAVAARNWNHACDLNESIEQEYQRWLRRRRAAVTVTNR